MEVRKVFENVQGINSGLTSTGTLRLTDFHIVFSAPPPRSNKDGPPPAPRESWITYPMLCYCAFRPTLPTSGIPSSIRIRCRDFTFVTFNFQDDKLGREAFDFIRARTCKLGSVEKLYAFSHKPLKAEQEIKGWDLYDARAEFKRQGISEKSADKGWRISTVNQDYTFCDTYPALLVVPSSISDSTLKYAKPFRSRHRIPALSYLHPINGCTILRSSQPHSGIRRKTNPQDEKLVCAAFTSNLPRGASEELARSLSASEPDSQPGTPADTGLSGARTPADAGTSEQPDLAEMFDSEGKRLIYGAQQSNLIVDARPTINAIFNQMQGLGSENMDRYKNTTKVFLNIDNIHVMRSSLNTVVDAIKDADISSLPPNRDLLARSNWLQHLWRVLAGSIAVAKQIGIFHSHVLIHCSDGWDRTSQLSALAQLMLDPYYRSLEGFMVLVEKDWLSFGHMFRLRSGYLNHEDWFIVQKDALAGSTIQPGETDGRGDAIQSAIDNAKRLLGQVQVKTEPQIEAMVETPPGEVVESDMTTKRMVSPVFHQFLDCVYQMQRQAPDRFEFNERFLRRLLYHLYSCQYGTFLYNSEKQRHDADVKNRTSSVWDYFLSRRAEFTNPNYDATVDDHIKGRERLFFPNVKDIRWWHQAFNRSDEEMNSDLNATMVSDQDRATLVAGLQVPSTAQRAGSQPGTPARDRSPQPPSMPTSQSALGSVEGTGNPLNAQAAVATLQHSVSADSPGAFSTIRDGLAGLSLLNPLARASNASSSTASVPVKPEQELREMA
ncbi:related to myotubularin related protein 1 [Cephalotrichum gorgonifer]|uniref:Related to myotubularin related protein 1 n=1 Tax=Cephalotrichum gorgonifer TaxID=2041049 RepID=A0AAE8STX5_9PEZI|nr:related to myotubularin related protein 1 [Cephalotrichum gorgonifer]